ncbi:MAG: class I tRNA ligase family protein, partial [Oscillospiraceae bacterium]|nr:class I tRNA ligase family protein [Oscillospiraceae bacterium]
VSEDIEHLKFNTAIAALMTLLNELDGRATREELRVLLLLLGPFAPHIVEELWEIQGYGGRLTGAKYPVHDPAKCVEETVEIAVQVNGKIQARLHVPTDAGEEEVFDLVGREEAVARALEGGQVVKRLYVPGKLVNFVVKSL